MVWLFIKEGFIDLQAKLGGRLMVGQQVLVLFIGVRVPAPEFCL